MKSLKYSSVILAVLCCFVLTGCLSTKQETTISILVEKDDLKNARELGVGSGKVFVEAFEKQDYDLFISKIKNEDIKNFYQKDKFEYMFKRLGDVVNSEYLGEFRQQLQYVYMWKMTFERKNEEGDVLSAYDTLMKVVVIKSEDEYQVFGVVFQ